MKSRVIKCLTLAMATLSLCSAQAGQEAITAPADSIDTAVPEAAESESEFLTAIHYSHEDFVRIYESLPKDEDQKVDWERAIREGLINPTASIGESDGEEMMMDLRVVIKFNDMLVKDVVFSHEVHTYWLNCESCHPRLFVPQVGANPMTMTDVREGRYCGKCHGMVSFPTNVINAPKFRANCLRCHREPRG